MKIAILGTRGIPNNHGGFEQFAEHLAVYLVGQGYIIYVYNSNTHPHKENTYKNVKIIHCKDPEKKLGTVGHFIYDLNCILDARKRNFDIILQLGYTSSSIWGRLLPKNTIIITNMDGLEWKRTKFSKPVRIFLKYAEKLGVKHSDYLISDSIGIQKHLLEEYGCRSKYIAYGADLFNNPKEEILKQYKMVKYEYNMLIARIEPENNIETILDGIVLSKDKTPFLVIGKHDINKFGAYLKNKFKNFRNIYFLGGIYNIDHLNTLRFYSKLYFHGHSVGGTNPSLLEAMASNALIIANDNYFNRSILETDAFYFDNSQDISDYLKLDYRVYAKLIENNRIKIEKKYEWEFINRQYLNYFNECVFNLKKRK